jgi:hypothetical protein
MNQLVGEVQGLEDRTLRSGNDDPGLVVYGFDPVVHIPGGGDFGSGHLALSPEDSTLPGSFEDLLSD